MPALSPNKMHHVEDAHTRLRERFVDAFTPKIDMTVEDVLHAVVPERFWTLAEEAMVLGETGNHSYEFELKDPEFPDKRLAATLTHFPDAGRYARAFPFLWNHKPQGVGDALVRVQAWAAKAVAIRREWDQDWAALRDLNWGCSNLKQLRFYSPCIITLLDYAGESKKADEVRTYAVPRDLVHINPPHKAVIARLQTNVIKATMLPEQVKREHEVVRPSLGNWYFRPDAPWHNWTPPTEDTVAE